MLTVSRFVYQVVGGTCLPNALILYCIVDQSVVSPLVAYKDRLFPMCESALLESNEYNGLRLAGLKGLELMALSKDYLTQDEVSSGIDSGIIRFYSV